MRTLAVLSRIETSKLLKYIPIVRTLVPTYLPTRPIIIGVLKLNYAEK